MKIKLITLSFIALFVAYKSFASDFNSFSTCERIGIVDWQVVCLDQYTFITDSL